MIFLAKQREQEKLLLLSLESLRTRLSSIRDRRTPCCVRKPHRAGWDEPILPGQIWMN